MSSGGNRSRDKGVEEVDKKMVEEIKQEVLRVS